MTPEEKIKCGNMFGVAKTYKESAELLDGMNQIVTAIAAKQDIKAPGGRALNFDHVILTRIILYGIAIEIYLKALLFADGVAEQRTHEWDKLFSSLPAARQTEIINAIGETFRANFANLLSANKDIFVKWRYSYEETSLTCDISFVKELSDVLGSIVMKLIN